MKSQITLLQRRPLAMAIALVMGSAVQSRTMNVGAGGCGLANAIRAANADAPVGGCPAGSGADTLRLLNASFTKAGPDDLTYGPTGYPLITSQITIQGDPDGNGVGVVVQRSSAPGTPSFRLFAISPGGDLTLDHVTLKSGDNSQEGDEEGSALLNHGGQLKLLKSVVTANTGTSCAVKHGGGATTLLDSKISGNGGCGVMAAPTNYVPPNYSQPPQLMISGGRILNNKGDGVGCYWFSKCTISASTISGNAQDGVADHTYNGVVSITDSRITLNGGIGVYGGHSRMPGPKIANSEISINGLGGVRVNGGIDLKNSTISGNGGIGLYVGYRPGCRSGQIDNVTITGNHGGGASFCGYSPGLLLNTIIAGNLGEDCSNLHINGPGGPSSLQGTLIGDGSCDAAALGALTGDAKLAPLLDNGGLTLTHGLRFGLSPAINAGLAANCQTTDQRSIARPQDSACDIGAFELITTAHPSVAAADAYLTASVQAKAVTGTGAGTMPGFRVRAVRQQLRVAGDLVDQGKTADACAQLTRTLTRIDTDGASPDDDDYLTGPSSPDLVKQVRTSRRNLGCT